MEAPDFQAVLKCYFQAMGDVLVKPVLANRLPTDWKQVSRAGFVFDCVLESLETSSATPETLASQLEARLGAGLPSEAPLLFERLLAASHPIDRNLIRDWLLSPDGQAAMVQLSAFKPHQST